MDIVNRARNIMLRPGLEWPIIATEKASVGDLYSTYLMPLGLIGPIATFIGLTVIGVSIPFLGTYHTPFLSGLVTAILSFAAVLIGVFLWSLIVNGLAPTFSGQRSRIAALQVVVFAATPALLAGILSLIPALGILQVFAALYGLYLLFRGLPILMHAPPEKAFGYTALTVVCGIGIGLVFGVVIAALHLSPFGQMSTLGRVSDQAVAQSAIAGVIGAAAGGSDDSKKAAESLAAGVVAAAAIAKSADAATKMGGGNAATDKEQADSTDAKTTGAAAATGIAAIGALIGGGKTHVQVVDFHALKALLPAAVGALAQTDAGGETSSAAGLQTSKAEGRYGSAGSANINVKITDMGNAAGLLAMGKLAFSMESESDSGYEKNVMVGNRKVHEKWTASGKQSELTAFVADRYLVEVNGSGVDAPNAERAIAAIDFDKLAALQAK